MIYFINDSTSPYFNLALEEVLMHNEEINPPIFLLWQNYNTVVIGKNQNTIGELNNEYVADQKIRVVRRLSGGGAVYQDQGNLCFTFIVDKQNLESSTYEYFTLPIIKVLRDLGLNANFSGKNDLVIDDKKFSGNAQYKYQNKVLHHGTILFDVDMNILPQVLKPDLSKLESKGIKSISARVTNIFPLLSHKITINDLKEFIIAELVNNANMKIKTLPAKIIDQAQALALSKYEQWWWNYGYSPAFNLTFKSYFPAKGTIETCLSVEEGKILEIKIFGDFLGTLGTNLLEEQLSNQLYESSVILKIIREVDITKIFGPNFSPEEILSAIIK